MERDRVSLLCWWSASQQEREKFSLKTVEILLKNNFLLQIEWEVKTFNLSDCMENIVQWPSKYDLLKITANRENEHNYLEKSRKEIWFNLCLECTTIGGLKCLYGRMLFWVIDLSTVKMSLLCINGAGCGILKVAKFSNFFKKFPGSAKK